MMPLCPANPVEILNQNLEQFSQQFQGNQQDWQLLNEYLLMPLFDINSTNELKISQKEKNRLYTE